MKTSLTVIPTQELEEMISKIVKAIILEEIPPQKEAFSDLPEYLTRKQAKKVLNVCLTKIDQLANEGRLKKYHNGNLVRFKKSEVLEFYQTFQKWGRS